MLKITETTDDGTTVRLRLDGTLCQACFPELEASIARHKDDRDKTILLDMKGVDFLDNESAGRLIRLRRGPLSIVNCSPFLEALLNTVGEIE